MRKNLLLTVLFVIAFASYSFAQCTPDTTMGGLTKPTEAQGLDTAYATFLYETVVHIHIPEDTVVPGVPISIPIDSAKLLSVVGMPASLNYYPNKASKTWNGGEYGCFLISGTPLNSEVGTYSISMTINVYSNNDSIDQNLTFDFTVADSSFYNSIKYGNEFDNTIIYPNPADDNIYIKYHSENNKNINFELYNSLGQLVLTEALISKPGKNTSKIDIDKLPNGVYFYNLSGSYYRKTGKIIVR